MKKDDGNERMLRSGNDINNKKAFYSKHDNDHEMTTVPQLP